MRLVTKQSERKSEREGGKESESEKERGFTDENSNLVIIGLSVSFPLSYSTLHFPSLFFSFLLSSLSRSLSFPFPPSASLPYTYKTRYT